jgi:Ca2+-binding RTX toxin-like protein
MRSIATDLDTNLAADTSTDVEAVRLVTTDFTYTTQIAEPSEPTTAFTLHPALADIAVTNVGVFELVDENDLIVGTDGADIRFGGAGNDLMVGLAGDDTLYGGEDHDTLVGGDGNDMLLGENGHDWIIGDAGNDTLLGGEGDDTLEGRAGDDRLEGGFGNDIMKGGDGNDTLVAGAGQDVMTGGAGYDKFVVLGGGHYYGGLDKVTDFQTGGGYTIRDFIDLREALKASTFTGYGAVQAFQQGYIYLVEHGTPGEEGFGTTVYMDRNGSAPDYGYHYDIALVDLVGVAKDQLHVGYYGGNFIA